MAVRSMGLDLGELADRLAVDAFWGGYLRARNDVGMHLAVFSLPLLGLVLEGRKTVESRCSRVRCAPWAEISSC